ncbi:MAG: carbon-nitrogen hydrolase family protein, partial [Vicinamibacteria bacterium]
ATAEALVAEAAGRGARLVGLPENFGFLRSEGEPVPEPQDLDGPWVQRMAAAARRHALTLLLGSLPERIPGVVRIHNTSVLLGPDGRTLAVYRKIHLFDIDLPGLEHLKESLSVVPGDEVVTADVGFATIGLSICYDLRFPELYRELARRGAEILAVPSAFTERTGKDHWEVLLRARAIENQAYVLAPAQVGDHGGGRASHGHAMIVDPWGTVVAQAAGGEGVAVGPIDLAHLAEVRRHLPALAHARL